MNAHEIQCVNWRRPIRCAEGHAVACYPDLSIRFTAAQFAYSAANDGGRPDSSAAQEYRAEVLSIWGELAARESARKGRGREGPMSPVCSFCGAAAAELRTWCNECGPTWTCERCNQQHHEYVEYLDEEAP